MTTNKTNFAAASVLTTAFLKAEDCLVPSVI